MKISLSLLISAIALAMVQPSAAQKTAYETNVDGVKVIVQPSGNQIVEIQTVLQGGVHNYPPEKAGIESLAMTALTECGTLKHNKNAFKDQLEKVGGEIYGYSGKDYSVIRMNCIKMDFNTVWPLYAEAIKVPAFDPKEFERVRSDAVTNLKQNDAQPDRAIDKFADRVAFHGSPYAEDPEGSPEIISKITPSAARSYYHSILTRSRMVIVVVSSLDRGTIIQKIRELLAGISGGRPFQLKASEYRPVKSSFTAEERQLATNYIEGISGAPAPGTPDFNAFSIAMRIFFNRHFLEVRTKNGLSYAPQAWLSTGSTSVAKFSVSTTEPERYINVFRQLLDTVKKNGFNEEEVADTKATYLTGFYYRQETNQAQAASLVASEALFHNWRRSLTLVRDMSRLNAGDVNAAFRKYVHHIVWVYQGDPAKAQPADFSKGMGR